MVATPRKQWTGLDTFASTIAGFGLVIILGLFAIDETATKPNLPWWLWALGYGLIAAGIILFGVSFTRSRETTVVPSVVLSPKSGEMVHATIIAPGASPTVPASTDPRDTYSGQIVRLVDLAPALDQPPVIRRKHFADCRIHGPAIVVLLGETVLADSTFASTPEGAFWLIEEVRNVVEGAIGLEDCTFVKCRFLAVGIAGTAAQIEGYRKGFDV